MNEIVKKLYKPENDIFGLPQEFKGLKIYPILLKDLHFQDLFYKIFSRPKSYISNFEILKSSYLKFVVYILTTTHENQDDVLENLVEIMRYLTKEEDIEIFIGKANGTGLQSFDVKMKIGKVVLNENDFDNLREMVLEQNGTSIEYVESYNPELEPALEFLNRGGGDLTLQDQIFTFCAIMKLSLFEMNKYTLYQFSNMFEKLLTLKEYDLYKPLLASGQITLKSGELKSYLYHSKKSGRYDSLMVDADAFLEKSKEMFG